MAHEPNQQQQAQTSYSPQPGGTGLPPTGLQQQLQSLMERNQMYGQAGGFNPNQYLYGMSSQGGGQALPGMAQAQAPGQTGTTSLQQLANKLAQSYGLAMGRGNLFDPSGNPLMTPEQLAAASGGAETMGTAAAKMQFIADAIARYQTEQSQKKAEASLQAGTGLVQSRARGSLAAMQSGMYSEMASLYANQEYEAADFSYYIQREQQLLEQKYREEAEKRREKGAILGVAMGAIGLVAAPFTGGATLGLAAQGLGQLANTGWI